MDLQCKYAPKLLLAEQQRSFKRLLIFSPALHSLNVANRVERATKLKRGCHANKAAIATKLITRVLSVKRSLQVKMRSLLRLPLLCARSFHIGKMGNKNTPASTAKEVERLL